MRIALFLTGTLILGASCASHTISPIDDSSDANKSTPPAVTSPTPLDSMRSTPKEPEKKKDVPSQFSAVDFKNFSYPVSWRRRPIRVEDGRYEYSVPKYLGGGWVDFKDVDYSDLNGDGRKEAIVRLIQVMCGGSCDGGSYLFYFYSLRRGKLKLLSRLETGSIAYECGLRSFVLNKQKLALELFKPCRFKGTSFVETPENPDGPGGKFSAHYFTRFLFEFDGRRFVPKKRKVLPNPLENVLNYSPKVSIN